MSVGAVLLDILIVLIAAKVAAEIAERVGFPAVVAEILAGVLIGPSMLDWVGANETLRVLGELGVILLLLQVGMEMNLGELGAVGRASIGVAVVGVVVPMAAGFGVATGFGHDANTSLFLGAALAATSVGITARVFSDLRALATVEARTVLGAAVADDVLGLIILTVVVRVVTAGSVSLLSVAGILGIALGFLVVTTVVGSKAAPPLFQALNRYSRSPGTLVAVALAFALAFGELAEAAKLAPIVGAFVAGLSLSRSNTADRISRELAPVGHLFIPVFFLEIGIDANADQFFRPAVLGIAVALFVVAVAGKLVAAVGATGSPGDKPLIGIGMIPRGEVGLIFATIGLQEGVLGRDLYASLLLVVLATTLVAPPLLRWRLNRIRAERGRRADATSPMPAGGWLRTDDGVVDLAATPPDRMALNVGLQAALAMADARPGNDLLDWMGGLGNEPLRWDQESTELLFAVLQRGNERTWRFLETSGVLERALPELADAVRRRRADPFLIDPAQVLRFSLVERIRDLAAGDPRAAAQHSKLTHPEWLLLAALILDTAGEDASPVEPARRLVKRLDLGAAAEQEIALLVGDSNLMRAAANRVDAFDEERVFQLAAHLERPERARALYLLTLALGDSNPVEEERLDQLDELVLALLERVDLTGLEARNLVERRRAEAIRASAGEPPVVERIQVAPRAYLLAQEASDVARQAALLEPLPLRGRARVNVTKLEQAEEGGPEWRVEVACHDRAGLLATVAGVLADHRLDVLDAVVATWPDEVALESFRVQRAGPTPASPGADQSRTADPPDGDELAAAIVVAFDAPLSSPPNPKADVTFDDDASPWYTLCEVLSPDRPGLLHHITVALASAGANVHSARLVTTAGLAADRFELTDRNDRKLNDGAKTAIVEAIANGVTPRKRLAGRRRH
jgi:Kef-type K+ transport system membrane component KefB/predicted amino acid-binding ACT domain protein